MHLPLSLPAAASNGALRKNGATLSAVAITVQVANCDRSGLASGFITPVAPVVRPDPVEPGRFKVGIVRAGGARPTFTPASHVAAQVLDEKDAMWTLVVRARSVPSRGGRRWLLERRKPRLSGVFS